MGTVTNIFLRARKLASAALMAISFAVWAPLSVLACSTTGGSASATGTGGGRLSNPSFGPIDPHAAANAVVAGFVLTLGLAARSTWAAVVVTLRRRPHPIPVKRLS